MLARLVPAALVAALSLAIALPASAEGSQPNDAELAKYWNVELAVPTLSNPTYSRAGAFEAALGLPLNVKLGYGPL